MTLRRTVRIEPRSAVYRFLLAEQFDVMGFIDEATENYRRAGYLDDYEQDYVRRVHIRAGLITSAEVAQIFELGDEQKRTPEH